MKTWPLIAALIGCLLAAAPAAGQDAAALGAGPLSLDAANGFEWRREERLLIAEGQAVAQQADVTLKADRMVAAYRTDAKGGMEIYRLDAEGAVRIENKADIATGGRASFDLAARRIVLTGPGLSYVTDGAAVTATRSLEYDLDARKATARGDARVEDRRGRLTAPIIEASLAEAPGQGVALARAWGGVVIQTGGDTVRADRAQYDFKAGKAMASGDVRIARGPNVLTGARADIDFQAGVSKLSGDGKAGGDRVRGLVFPQAKP